jgi:hydroxymethylglutaryl-CoA lyase
LADAEDVFRRIERHPGILYSALVPNDEGLDRALNAGANKIAVFTAASETFARQNINATIDQSIRRFRSVVARAPMPVRGYVSTAFHCPFEGPIPPTAVLAVAEALLGIGCIELSLGDTIGKATPDEVQRLLELLLRHLPVSLLALHFHDTAGRAVANAKAAAALGIRSFDGSAGGIGGCPFAPGAPGNVATEALVETFGPTTGVDLERLRAASSIVRSHLRAPGAVTRI